MRSDILRMKTILGTTLITLMVSIVGVTKSMAQTNTYTSASQPLTGGASALLTSTPIRDTIKAKTVGIIPYSDDFITQEEVMDRYYSITSFRMIDTATVAVLTGASDMILVYSFEQNQILRKIQLPISARAFDYDNDLFHVIGDRTYLSIDAEGRIRERKDFQEPKLPNEEVFIISDLKIIDGQPVIHECNANTYSINSDGLQKIDTFYYDRSRGCKIHPKYIDENSLVIYSETPSKSGRSNVSMASLGLEGKLACLNPISVDDDFIAINLQTSHNRTGRFVKSYLLVVNPSGELINLVEVPINFLSYISKPFCYQDNAWYYAFSGQEGISIFKIGTNTNRIDSPDSFLLSDYYYREPENVTSREDTSSHSSTRGSMDGWRTITQTWYNGNQYRTLEWTPVSGNIVDYCYWIEGTGYRPGYIKTPAYIATQPNEIKMGVPYKRAGFTKWQDFKYFAGLGRKTGNCYHPDNTTCSGDCYWETTDAYVIGVDCSGFVSRCWEFSYAEGTNHIPDHCTPHGDVVAASESDFQKGDALNWAGHHVMLYTGHTSGTHRIAVFESTATDEAWRTVANDYDAVYFGQYGRDYKIHRLNLMKNIILRLNSAITMSQNGSTVTTVTRGQPLTVNYSVKNFGSETWSGDVRLFIEQSTGEEVPLNPVYSVTLAPGESQSFTFSNNEVISPVGTTKFYVRVKNYNAGGDDAYYDVGGGGYSNPLVFEIVEGGNPPTPSCKTCPDYDETWNILSDGEWQTRSSSISTDGCRIYRVALLPSYTYTFQTCNPGSASFDTRLYLYNPSCNMVVSDDDGCSSGNLSSLEYTNTGNAGYYYLKIDGYNGAGGSFTIAGKREGGESPSTCSSCPDYDESWNINNVEVGEWTTKSSSIGTDGCRIYRVPLMPYYTYTFQTGCDNGDANFDTRLYLYDASCEEVAFDDDGCSNHLSSIKYRNTTGSTAYYYLKIDGYEGEGGSYTIASKRESCSSCPEYDEIWPVNNAGVGNWTYKSSSIVSGGCSIYRVTLSSSYTYTFQTCCEGYADFDTQLYLYDSDCNVVAENDDANGTLQSSIEYTNTGGSSYFYLKVNGFDSAAGSYTIAAKRENPIINYVIDVSASPSSGGTVGGAGTYQSGSSCTLTASPNTGYSFAYWTKNGAQVSNNATFSFTVTESASYVAVFSLNNYTISASSNPTEGGTVSGGGIFSYGSTCNLTASPAAGYSFVRWTRNNSQVSTNPSYSFTVTGDASYVAVFSLNSYTISASASPSAGGSVSGAGSYYNGCTCTLTASANTGYSFVRWTKNGNQVSTNPSYTFTVMENASYVAVFILNNYTISASANSSAGGTVSGAGTYSFGSTCTLNALPNSGYDFVQWTENGSQVSTYESYSFIVTGDASFVAVFEQSTTTQSQPLATGWNWWSTYVEQSGSEGLTQLENSLGAAGVIIKSRNDGYVESYVNNGTVSWFGQLNALSNEQMYKINTNASSTAMMTGYEAGTSSHPIAIAPGWNWIGFPVSHSVGVSTAMAAFSPAANDIIKGRNSFTTYYSDSGQQYWFGTLNTLEPGSGYMYQSQSSNLKTLVFQAGRGETTLANITPEDNFYRPEDQRYADNMTVTAVLEVDGEEVRSEAYEVAAFCGDECRGSVRLIYVEPVDRYVAFLTVFGETGETIEFRLTYGEETMPSEDVMGFVSDGITGSIVSPAVLHFGTTGVSDASAVVRIFPNPVKRKGQLHFTTPAESGQLQVEIVNMLGVTVCRETVNVTPMATASLTLPEAVLPGTYVLKAISHKGTVYYGKLMVE